MWGDIGEWFKRNIQRIAWCLLAMGVIMVIYFLINAIVNGYWIWGGKLNIAETGEVGDFVGGFVGTIISAAGFLFLYLTLKEQRQASEDQRKSFEKERFESRFFELLKFHRENVSAMKIELKYDKALINETHEGAQAIKFVYQQVMEARDEIKPFFRKIDVSDFYDPTYYKSLEEEFTIKKRKISLKEIAKMNIAYHVVFFGVDYYGKHIIKNALERKYDSKLIGEILDYMALKPLEQTENWDSWRRLRKMEIMRKKESVKNIYWLRQTQSKRSDVTLADTDLQAEDDKPVFYRDNYIKYYGGHQIRLGHYFRHLFQMVNYVNDNKLFQYQQKYDYVKLLRAQMSTYEQVVFYFNSLSSIGDIWELCISKRFKNNTTPPSDEEIVNKQLVTKYNLIKNLANGQLLKQSFTRHYPDINYEFQDFPNNRILLEKKYI